MNIDKLLENYLKTLKLDTSCEIINKIKSFLNLIYEKNKFLNLVGTKDKNSILIRHFFDCLSIFEFFKELSKNEFINSKILDVGTGAGLPGILLAIILKNSTIYLLEPRVKISNFLTSALKELDIKNAEIILGRAEVLSHNEFFREKFNYVTARAVADVKVLSELTIPFCKIGGSIIMYKSKKLQDEILSSGEDITVLGGSIDRIMEVEVPLLNECRVFLIIKKQNSTLYKYPRKYVKILKKLPDNYR
ncbi:MAG: 16S rRNA (guanine(527)-N(7))-methyltransferase RsmG [Actinobacteria bacterium]|nr:16S rRNA (guanine(527)-N(7))-methyltransferase RsmG [Actinomycetota bacterium]